jgi:hypothetical protein
MEALSRGCKWPSQLVWYNARWGEVRSEEMPYDVAEELDRTIGWETFIEEAKVSKPKKGQQQQDMHDEGERWVIAAWRDGDTKPMVTEPLSEAEADYVKRCRINEKSHDHVIKMQRNP